MYEIIISCDFCKSWQHSQSNFRAIFLVFCQVSSFRIQDMDHFLPTVREITMICTMNDETSKNGLHITIVQKGGKQFMIQYLNPLRHKIEIIDVQCRLTRNHSFNAPKAIIC